MTATVAAGVPERRRLGDVFEHRQSCIKTSRQVDLRSWRSLRIFADTVEQGQFLHTTR